MVSLRTFHLWSMDLAFNDITVVEHMTNTVHLTNVIYLFCNLLVITNYIASFYNI